MTDYDDVTAAAAAGGWLTYAEGHTGDVSFEDWLQKNRPSRPELQNWAWISVRASSRPKTHRNEDNISKEDGADLETSSAKIASELAAKIQNIESDPSIPVRAKKSKGELSKKDRREQEYEITRRRLENLARDKNLLSGKWLFFPSTEHVDGMWTKIAKAIIEDGGALRGKVYDAKVSPYQPGDGEKPSTHVVCVYVEDSWNKDLVKDVFVTLVKELALVPSSYKADIYTYAGIDSKHPSKMRSTLWQKNDMMSKEEIDAVFEARKAGAPVVVKKQVKGTGFVDSGSEDEDEEAPKAKRTKT